MVIRYLDAGQLLSSSSRSQRRERLLLAVRTYLRKQWLHFFSLAICSLLILADTVTTCDDTFGSYMTSAAFPGLGLLLSLDRLTSLGKEERTPQFGDASPSGTLRHGGSENMELASPNGPNTATLRSFPPVSESPFGAAGYRLLDFSALLEHLISYLRCSVWARNFETGVVPHGTKGVIQTVWKKNSQMDFEILLIFYRNYGNDTEW